MTYRELDTDGVEIRVKNGVKALYLVCLVLAVIGYGAWWYEGTDIDWSGTLVQLMLMGACWFWVAPWLAEKAGEKNLSKSWAWAVGVLLGWLGVWFAIAGIVLYRFYLYIARVG